MPWSVGWSTPVRRGLCFPRHPYNSGIAYPYRYPHHWTTIQLARSMVHPLGSNTRCKSWSYLGCSWRSRGGQWGGPPLSGISHISYNSHQKYNIAYPYMYHHPWTTTPLMRSVVQAINSKNQRNSWVCMCKCLVTLPWPKFYAILLNYPSGTYIKYVASPDIKYWATMALSTN